MSLRADIENTLGDTLDTMHLADVIRLADALMPIVERVAREGARAGYVCSGRKPHDEWLDAIVARVVGRSGE